jgi:hypothetical protein
VRANLEDSGDKDGECCGWFIPVRVTTYDKPRRPPITLEVLRTAGCYAAAAFACLPFTSRSA